MNELNGIYPATIRDVVYAISNSNGRPTLKWLFTANGRFGEFFTPMDELYKIKDMILALDPNYDLTHFVPSKCGDQLRGRQCLLHFQNGFLAGVYSFMNQDLTMERLKSDLEDSMNEKFDAADEQLEGIKDMLFSLGESLQSIHEKIAGLESTVEINSCDYDPYRNVCQYEEPICHG